MSADLLDVGSTEMATTETLPFAVDFAPLLSLDSSTINGNPVTQLANAATFVPVTLADNPSVSGTQAIQPVRGTELAEGQTYYLLFTITTTTGKVWTQRLTIRCRF